MPLVRLAEPAVSMRCTATKLPIFFRRFTAIPFRHSEPPGDAPQFFLRSIREARCPARSMGRFARRRHGENEQADRLDRDGGSVYVRASSRREGITERGPATRIMQQDVHYGLRSLRQHKIHWISFRPHGLGSSSSTKPFLPLLFRPSLRNLLHGLGGHGHRAMSRTARAIGFGS